MKTLFAPVRAGRWWFAVSRVWARRRCWTTLAGQARGLPGRARAIGVQSEMELAFAGVHQLCAPMLDRLERLPVPQRDALRTAFGARCPAPDRFLVGLAVLSLLADAAGRQPLICLVDDHQWLDRASAQVLAFVGAPPGRGVGRPGLRGPDARRRTGRVADAEVEGLREGDARALLESVLTGPLDRADPRPDRRRDASRNPLALLELPPGPGPASWRADSGCPERCRSPGASRRASGGSSTPFRPDPAPPAARGGRSDRATRAGVAGRRAARDPPEAAAPAIDAELVEFGAWVRFRHPLVRSAAYRSASPQDRQDVHRALAEVTDPQIDPDRRAWHRAQAAPVPDEEMSPPSWSVRPAGPRRAAAWPRRRRSSSARRC